MTVEFSVLLMEPDPSWRMILQRDLNKVPKDGEVISLVCKTSWEEAFQSIDDHHFDLIVTDLVGQRADGDQTLGFRLVEQAGPEVKAIVVSGPGADDWQVVAFLERCAGRAAYVRKAHTYSSTLLRSKARELLFGESADLSISEVFVSYSHRDGVWADRVETMLTPLQQAARVRIWSDRNLVAGTRWHREITEAIERADAAILLVTPNFLAAGYIINEELPALLRRQRESQLPIFWILAEPCLWARSPLKDLEAANDPSRPLDSMTTSECSSTLVDIAERVINSLEA